MSSLQIRFLGGTHEVGRNAIAVKSEKTQILLDYGVMFNHAPGFPMHVSPKEVDALILSHSHLDHSGALPIFYINDKKPLYANKLNLELTRLLISDFIHLSSYFLPFEYLELNSMMRSSKHLNFEAEEQIGDLKIQLFNAGHIPGSTQILVEGEGKRMLYTSDFNTDNTRLLAGASMEYGELDAVIIESTYADENHSERGEIEKNFVKECVEVVEKGGIVLIPAFGVGRAQEIMCILVAHHFEYNIAIDGMARAVSRIIMDHKEFLKDPKLFTDAMSSVEWIEGWRDRRKASKTPGVIISPAGMLKGGPSVYYTSKIATKSQNAIFLVSFQIPGTPGSVLLDKGICLINGKMRKVKARVAQFDFSSHCGARQLKAAVKKLKSPQFFVIHGSEGNCQLLAKWVRKEMGVDATAPKVGEMVKL